MRELERDPRRKNMEREEGEDSDSDEEFEFVSDVVMYCVLVILNISHSKWYILSLFRTILEACLGLKEDC